MHPVSFYTTESLHTRVKPLLRTLAALLLLPLMWSSSAFAAAAAAAPEAAPTDDLAKRYEDARVAFEKGDYKRAQYVSESLLKDSLDQGKVSPQLFQLMGHTRYRQGDLGRAALWYMRAALFPPPTQETMQNLAHIRQKTGNLAFAANRFGDQYTSLLTRPQWMQIVIVSAWALVFSVVLFIFIRSSGWRTLFLLIGLLAVVGGGLGFTGWKLRPTHERLKDLAIVTATNAQTYTAASTTAGKVIALPPGSQVRKLEDRGAWTYVETWREETGGGAVGQMFRGWVQTDALSTFWPFDAKFLD